jgi:hypothetical protein
MPRIPKLWKNTDSKKQIVKNKFLILSPSENVNVVRNSVCACLQNLVATARTVPAKKVHEYGRFTIADIEGTIRRDRYKEFKQKFKCCFIKIMNFFLLVSLLHPTLRTRILASLDRK